MRNEVLTNVKDVIRTYIDDADCGIFNCKGIVPDPMETVYYNEVQGIKVDMCRSWSYFEVFGLTDVEFDDVQTYYEDLLKMRKAKEVYDG